MVSRVLRTPEGLLRTQWYLLLGGTRKIDHLGPHSVPFLLGIVVPNN